MSIAWSYIVEVIGVDGLVMHELKVHIHRDPSALSVEGAIGDDTLAYDILDNASDAIRGYHERLGGLVVPGKDVAIQGKQVRQVNIVGPIENRAYALAVIASAKTAIRDMHARRALAKATEQGSRIEI